jgi:2-polyprenyl-3-methyl-5-hydroxy-6-metoxy-1,4-benzoquinol methylase
VIGAVRATLRRLLRSAGWDLVRAAGRDASRTSLFSKAEFAALVRQMDAGDFTFSEATRRKMVDQWLLDNTAAPYPTAITSALENEDPVAFNSAGAMEITYRLPYSEGYERSQEPMYRALIAWALDQGVRIGGAAVADVGCGWGGLLGIVGGQSPPPRALFGVEIAASAVEHIAAHRPSITGFVADLGSTAEVFSAACPFTADVTFCTAVLEHLLDPEQAVRNLLSLLNPGGALVLAVPNGRADTAKQHVNFWSPESWRRFVARAAAGRSTVVGRCPSAHAPGGFENVALVR